MSQKNYPTKRTFKKRHYHKKKKEVLAYDSCDIRPNYKEIGGRAIDSYVLEQDLYLERTKRYMELSSEKYVPFLNYTNNLLDTITSILNTSPTNRGIIMQKVMLSIGGGLYLKDSKQRLGLEIDTSLDDGQLGSLINYIDEVNPDGESLEDIAEKVYYDWWAYGNSFVELIRVSVDGERKLVQRHIPIDYCRPKVSDETLEVKYIGISNRWVEDQIEPVEVRDVPLYPNFEASEDGGSERSIIHIKNYAPGFYYWGVPDWIAAFLWGEMEYRIPKYNQSKFKNGYTPSAIISFFGQMDSEEAQKLIDHFTSKFTDTGNNSKMFVQVLSDESMKADVQTLEDSSDGSYMDLSELARKNIVTAHRWTTALAGMGVAGQLGSNQQIRSEFEILNKMVIAPVQRKIARCWIKPSIKEAAMWENGGFEGANLGFKTTIPISFLGDIDPAQVLTVDEQREELGQNPIDNNELLKPSTNERSNNTN